MKKFLFLSLALILGNGFAGAQNSAETSAESSQEVHKYEGAIKIDWIYTGDEELSKSRMLNTTYSYVLTPQNVRLKTGEIHCWRDKGVSEHLYGYYENGKRNKIWKYELKSGSYTANISGLYNNSKRDGLWSIKTTGVNFKYFKNGKHYLANRDFTFNYKEGVAHGDFEMIISGNGQGSSNITIEIKGKFLDGKITGDYTAETKIVNDEGILGFHCIITQSDEGRNFGSKSIYFPMTGITKTYEDKKGLADPSLSLEYDDLLDVMAIMFYMKSLEREATNKFIKFEMPQDNEL